MKILGISAFYHDSSACIINNGEIISAVQEERFTRNKNDKNFPLNSINYCLKQSNIKLSELDAISFYENNYIKFNRLLHTYLHYAPQGMESFSEAMKEWIPTKLFLKSYIKKILKTYYDIPINRLPRIVFQKHHFSHAASAFFPSPFKKSLILCIDGVGEWSTTSIWEGINNKINLKKEIKFPHSLGLLYSAFTYYLGFKVNSGEYKVMGLAPYGQDEYKELILKNLIDVKQDGSFHLNMDFFNFHIGSTMVSQKFCELFKNDIRKKEDKITNFHMNVANSLQSVTNHIILKICKNIQKEERFSNLCLAGGVALNCVSNGKISDEKLFKNIWVQPSSGDSGAAAGAALGLYFNDLENKRVPKKNSGMQGSYLGPEYSDNDVKNYLNSVKANYIQYKENDLLIKVARLISKGHIFGWFQGRMEFGPRALGNRSILGDPRDPKLQKIMNLKIKKRESFRPFAPSILEDKVEEFFNETQPSPYMNFVTQIRDNLRVKYKSHDKKLFGIDLLNVKNSIVPAVTHVDFSSRIQTVRHDTNKKFYNLIKEFYNITKIPILINTSFNVRGEPIVCTPEDAYRCFMTTDLDYLVINNFLLYKKSQNPEVEKDYFNQEFESD